MKTKKYFIISALALLAYSCQDEEQGSVQPTPGQEVQFGASLEKNATRTIYGDENDKGFPIYWVEGDEVVVFSPECANNGGVGSATYKVHVDKETQNYASSLNKTGDIGVRWGDNLTGSFYSIYPASSLYTKIGNDYKTATLTMPAQQDNNIVTENGKKIVRSDMRSCFMYAETSNVKSGETVDLKYKPLSTALRFTLTGPQTGDPVTITYVRIYAPSGTYISGTCNVDLSTATNGIPTMTVVNGTGRNYVTMNAADASTGAYLTLAPGETIEMNAFLLIAQNTKMTDDWYIEIGTSSGISYKKYLDTSASDDKRTLVPGMVHRLSQALPPIASDQWSATNWMANLQRNVYLSEISIPGSWNSLNDDYQYVATISNQYRSGVRAFHLDTRWMVDDNNNVTELGVANNGTTYDGDGGKYIKDSNAQTIKSALDEIAKSVQDNEFMVVICTFAQGSADYNAGAWRQAISEACADNDDIIDARDLDENSVVADVLGRVIVIVNTYTEGTVDNSKCFFMNIPITQTADKFQDNGYYKEDLKYNNDTPSGILVYGTHAQLTSQWNRGTDEGDRGYAPSFAERESMISQILQWSDENYSNQAGSNHNVWIYLGLGGYIDRLIGGDDYSTVASTLNGWINGKVTEMANNGYYPIGIVLMNDVYDYSNCVQNILEMNNKYRKAYDPNRSPVDGSPINGTGNKTVQSAAPGYSSGMTDNQTDAIGWTRSR